MYNYNNKMYNKNGVIYFMNILTINNQKKYLELPFDIRKIVWKFLHSYPFVSCFICDKLLIDFEIRIDKILCENYTIINGLTKCNKCYID